MSDLVNTFRSYALDKDNCPRMNTEVVYVLVGLLKEAADRIEQLEAALRAVMDDLTLIGENHWLPVGLLDDVIYVNARATLEERT